MPIQIIGVPFNSAGRADGVARAPAVLREAGLLASVAQSVGPDNVVDTPDVPVGELRPERSPISGLLTEDALTATIENVRQAISGAHDAMHFPLVLGGDCPVLLGCLAATRERFGSAALFMVDGHQDNYPPHQSPTGEAADCELYIALGLPSEGLPPSISAILPLLEPQQVAVLGTRDEAQFSALGVKSLRGIVSIYTEVDVNAVGARSLAARAVKEVASRAKTWWLHLDLDVLASDQLDSIDYPQPGGLTWGQLAETTQTALQTPGCSGWTVAIYNPDLDPRRTGAEKIVEFIGEMAVTIPTRLPEVAFRAPG